MFISEIFYSIQGEGELTGMPSVFVRTSGCNLRCVWCDTKYASWHPEGRQWRIEDIIDAVCSFPTDYCVITGGEPMIAKGIHELTAELMLNGKHITIETAATVEPEGIVCHLASLSPKLANSTPPVETAGVDWTHRHEGLRYRPNIIQEWVANYDTQLKFVVCSNDDVQEIEAILDELRKFKRLASSKIFLMPEGVTMDIIRGREETLVDLCKVLGYRYCQRLQIELFGNVKGT